jgi:glucokinase
MIGALDIGGTKVAAGAVARDGRLLCRTQLATNGELNPKRALADIVSILRSVSREANEPLEGIGIGCTGTVHPLEGKIGKVPFLPRWEGLALVDELQRAFGISAGMENDADAAALAESVWGAGKGAERFLYITIGTGIGGGIILRGHIYRGADGSHPELGHHVIDPNGPRCSCGSRGCWESLACGPALAARGRGPNAQSVCAAAREGEPVSVTAVEQEGYYLGLGLANLITIFVPDVIALSGSVMQSGELFWSKIGATIRANCRFVPYEKTALVPAALGPDVGLMGAAQVWINRFGL